MSNSTRAPARQAAAGPPPADQKSTALALLADGQWLPFLGRYESDFSRVAPSHIKVEAFLGLAAAYVRRDANLQEATKANSASLIYALRKCAMLGHVPDPEMYALVPFRRKPDKAPGGWEVVGIETYKGVIQRMFRAGGISSVTCDVVRAGDKARFQRTRMRLPEHEYDEFKDPMERGPLRAVFAYAYLLDGSPSHVVWMPQATVQKHRASSRSGDAFWGPEWPGEGPWTESMWLKTALHGLEPYVPTSAEFRMVVAQSQAAAVASTGWQGVRPARLDVPDTLDAEVVDESTPQAQAQPAEGWPAVAQAGGGLKPDMGDAT